MPTGHLIVYGLGGNNTIMVGGKIALPVWIFGGGVNDTLCGGGGSNLLIGGSGKNQIICRSGQKHGPPRLLPAGHQLPGALRHHEAMGGGKGGIHAAGGRPAGGHPADRLQQRNAGDVPVGDKIGERHRGAADALFSAGDIPAGAASASVASSALDAAFAKPSADLPNVAAQSLPKISLATPAARDD